MKAIYSLFVALITIGSASKPNEAEALTVATACYQNPLPPAGLPIENALCQITWTEDGSVFTRGVKSSGSLQYWAGGGVTQWMHADSTAIRWSPASVPDPDQWVILCSDISGQFRLYGDGYVYRRVSTAGGGYVYQQFATAGDAVFTWINEPPNATCF